jgi:hypothetical protein
MKKAHKRVTACEPLDLQQSGRFPAGRSLGCHARRTAKALDRSHQAFKAAQRLASVQTISDKGKAALRKVGLHILIARGYEAIFNIATNQ